MLCATKLNLCFSTQLPSSGLHRSLPKALQGSTSDTLVKTQPDQTQIDADADADFDPAGKHKHRPCMAAFAL